MATISSVSATNEEQDLRLKYKVLQEILEYLRIRPPRLVLFAQVLNLGPQ